MNAKDNELVKITPHRVKRYQNKFLKKYAGKKKIPQAVALRFILDKFIQQHE